MVMKLKGTKILVQIACTVAVANASPKVIYNWLELAIDAVGDWNNAELIAGAVERQLEPGWYPVEDRYELSDINTTATASPSPSIEIE